MRSNVNLKKMKLISYVWGFLLLIIVIMLTVFGFYFKHVTQVYKNYETHLAIKTKEYLMDHSLLYEEDVTYSFDELEEFGILEDKQINGKECEGYVTVLYKNESYDYQAYIHCGMYKTKGYKK